MMVVSFKWGQKVYYIPYATKKLIAYFVICLLLFGINNLVHFISKNQPFNYLFATILLVSFIVFVAKIEKRELQSIFKK
jgi:energy-coupling factor transporter transmembrane protein EcfT